jgi:hypothetical protein
MSRHTVSERSTILAEELLSTDTAQRLTEGVAILPDRMLVDNGAMIAAFRPDAGALRHELRQAGIHVELAVPEGASMATYEEHAADWILPAILFVAGIPVAVVTAVVANWITSKLGTDAHATTVRYREGHCGVDGRVDVLEIDGPGDEVAQILRERGTSAAPNDSEP